MFAEIRYPQEKLKFILPSSPLLNQKAATVSEKELSSKEFQTFLDVMLRFAKGEQGDESRAILVGLAAPQVGVMKRVIIVDSEANGKGKSGVSKNT
jgi:peptide deformylase